MGVGQHLSPLAIGLRLLFVNGVTALANPIVGRLLTRWRPVAVLAVGLALGAVAMFLLTGLQIDTSIGDVAWRFAVFGVANAFMLSAVAVAAIHAVPYRLAGMAAAGNTALRQYGAALGPAVLGAILSRRMDGGASMPSAMHSAVILNAGLLLLVAVVCIVTAVVAPRNAGRRTGAFRETPQQQ
jgi:predicted MFS family arabinose efflux permease